jgi:hypothetical protein
MSEKAAARPIEEVLDLLRDSAFCADAGSTIMEAAEITRQTPDLEELQMRYEQLCQPFVARWGVSPPKSAEVLDADPRRRFSDAIASGRWGLLPVFPWTTNREIRARIKTIRPAVRKQHQDALINRQAHLVRWLEANRFDRPTIAQAVFGRQAGLQRPTTEDVIERTPEHRERQLYDEYRALGLTPKQVEEKVYQRLRGSEAPASAAVRMTAQRYVNRVKRLNVDLAKPVRSEPLSYSLTMLYRAFADEDAAAIRHRANAVQDAFMRAAKPGRSTAEGRDGRSPDGSSERIVSSPWGVVQFSLGQEILIFEHL